MIILHLPLEKLTLLNRLIRLRIVHLIEVYYLQGSKVNYAKSGNGITQRAAVSFALTVIAEGGYSSFLTETAVNSSGSKKSSELPLTI